MVRTNDNIYFSIKIHGLAPLDDSPMRGQEPGRELVQIQSKSLTNYKLLIKTKDHETH